jgi:hypothetical protein
MFHSALQRHLCAVAELGKRGRRLDVYHSRIATICSSGSCALSSRSTLLTVLFATCMCTYCVLNYSCPFSSGFVKPNLFNKRGAKKKATATAAKTTPSLKLSAKDSSAERLVSAMEESIMQVRT